MNTFKQIYKIRYDLFKMFIQIEKKSNNLSFEFIL